jgi:hypothetical protein
MNTILETDTDKLKNVIDNTIFELERNIAELNSNYKSLLMKLNVNIFFI